MSETRDYSDKRSFEATPEPTPAVAGNVDLATAPPGSTFVIHQHHARSLHFDLRLEMLNGEVPVLVSWAVPKNLPTRKGKPHLAIHVEDHPFDYGSFEGSIPKGNYGAGEVRIFDAGTYEVLEQERGKLSFRLHGKRLKGVYHLHHTDDNQWLAFLRSDERAAPEEPPPLSPMLATLIEESFDDERFIFEPKWDGVRTLAVCSDETRLLSRKGRDVTGTYPEVGRLHQQLVALQAIVDGEIVALKDGVPSFELLQSRINLQNKHDIERATKSLPVTFIAFDLLYLDGRSVIEQPIEKRKEMLESLVVPSRHVQVSPSIRTEGRSLSAEVEARHMEGIVAKRLGSPYRPGKRTKEWLKIKVTHEADVVVGGWSRGEGTRADSFGALLVGAYEGDVLRFLGAVGTGFSQRAIAEIMPLLLDLETDARPFGEDPTGTPSGFGKPLRAPHWVDPILVATVEYRELTASGRLRAPAFKGFRVDKAPEGCLYSELPPRTRERS
ncbi:MAG: non-homologous end-joining DNA ligase [Actinomycetota bacterium]